jgi:hypothetical protein
MVRAIEAVKGDHARTVEEWMALLAKGGAPKEEIRYANIEENLRVLAKHGNEASGVDTKRGLIPKATVLSVARGTQILPDEVVLGRKAPPDELPLVERQKHERKLVAMWQAINALGDEQRSVARKVDALKMEYSRLMAKPDPTSQEESFKLNRERADISVKFKAQRDRLADVERRLNAAMKEREAFNLSVSARPKPGPKPVYDEYQLPGAENEQEFVIRLPEPKGASQGVENSTYYAPHWDRLPHPDVPESDAQPDDTGGPPIDKTVAQNIVVSVLAADRQASEDEGEPNALTLFADEIQSDLQQHRRPHLTNPEEKDPAKQRWTPERFIPADKHALPNGYEIALVSPGDEYYGPAGEVLVATKPIYTLHLNMTDGDGELRPLKVPGYSGAYGYDSAAEATRAARQHARNYGYVPDFPFKDAVEYTKLAVRRMILEAVEAGYSRFAWANGDQSASKYSLGQHFSALRYTPSEKRLVAMGKNGGVAFDSKARGVSIETKDLPDYVGGEVAIALLQTEQTVPSGAGGAYEGPIPDARTAGDIYNASLRATQIGQRRTREQVTEDEKKMVVYAGVVGAYRRAGLNVGVDNRPEVAEPAFREWFQQLPPKEQEEFARVLGGKVVPTEEQVGPSHYLAAGGLITPKKGTRYFYDTIIPSAVKEVLKELGVKAPLEPVHYPAASRNVPQGTDNGTYKGPDFTLRDLRAKRNEIQQKANRVGGDDYYRYMRQIQALDFAIEIADNYAFNGEDDYLLAADLLDHLADNTFDQRSGADMSETVALAMGGVYLTEPTGRAPNLSVRITPELAAAVKTKGLRVRAESPEYTVQKLQEAGKLNPEGNRPEAPEIARQAFERLEDAAADPQSVVKGKVPKEWKVIEKITSSSMGAQLQNLREGNIAKILGSKIRNFHDLAVGIQLLRDPGVEHFNIIFLKKGQVVKIATHSDRNVSSASVFLPGKGDPRPQLEEFITKVMVAHKADAFYVAHNHPSGDPTPSQPDIDVTQIVTQIGDMIGKKRNAQHGLFERKRPLKRAPKPENAFKGHIVIDSNRYSYIDRNGTVYAHLPLDVEAVRNGTTPPDPLFTPDFDEAPVTRDLAGEKIVGSRVMVGDIDRGPNLQNKVLAWLIDRPAHSDRMVTLFWTNIQHIVIEATSVPMEAFEGTAPEIAEKIRDYARKIGANTVHAVTPNYKLFTKLGALKTEGIVTNAFLYKKPLNEHSPPTVEETPVSLPRKFTVRYDDLRSNFFGEDLNYQPLEERLDPSLRLTGANYKVFETPPNEQPEDRVARRKEVRRVWGLLMDAQLNPSQKNLQALPADERPPIEAIAEGREAMRRWLYDRAEKYDKLHSELTELISLDGYGDDEGGQVEGNPVLRETGPGAYTAPPPPTGPPDFSGVAGASAEGPQGPRAERKIDVVDKILTGFRALLLASFRTHELNAASNTVMAISETGKDPIATALDILVSKLTGRRTKSASLYGLTGAQLESLARAFQPGGAFREALNSAKVQAAVQKDVLAPGVDPATAEKYDIRQRVFDSDILQAASDLIFKPLGASDAVFKSAAYGRALVERARVHLINYDGKDKPKTKAEFNDALAKILANPHPMLIAAAIMDAEVATFQDPNKLADAIADLQKRLGDTVWSRLLVGLAMPFVKTPLNVAGRYIDYSPFGFVTAMLKQTGVVVRKQQFSAERQKELVEDMARASFGLPFYAFGIYLASRALMTGAYPDDDDERRQWEQEGKTPWSVRIRGHWVPIGKLGPIAAMMGLGAQYYANLEHRRESIDETEGASRRGAFGQSAFDLRKVVGEQTFVKGLGEVVTSTEKLSGVKRSATGIASSYFSIPLVRQILQGADSKVRDPDGLVQEAVTKNWWPYGMAPKTRPLGESVTKVGGVLGVLKEVFDPLGVRAANDDPVAKELESIGVPIPGVSWTVPDASRKKGKRNATEQEKRDTKVDRGPIVRASLSALFADERYHTLPVEEKQDAVERVLSAISTTENERQRARLGQPLKGKSQAFESPTALVERAMEAIAADRERAKTAPLKERVRQESMAGNLDAQFLGEDIGLDRKAARAAARDTVSETTTRRKEELLRAYADGTIGEDFDAADKALDELDSLGIHVTRAERQAAITRRRKIQEFIPRP